MVTVAVDVPAPAAPRVDTAPAAPVRRLSGRWPGTIPLTSGTVRRRWPWRALGPVGRLLSARAADLGRGMVPQAALALVVHGRSPSECPVGAAGYSRRRIARATPAAAA
jgi:hypothetical protein